MWREIRERPRALLYSLLLHGALLGLIAASLELTPRLPKPQRTEIIRAVVLDEKRVQQELARLEAAEAARRKAEEEALRRARVAREREQKRLEELRRRRAVEEKRLKALAAERKRQRREAERLAKLRRQREAEAARLARLKKEREALARRKAEEARRLAALERQRKIEEERRRKAAEEARRKAEEEARRKAEEAARRRALEEEQRRLAAERARLAAREIARYTDAIRQRVERSWVRPPGLPRGLQATLRVRLIPGGDVAAVEIARSSGNTAFDKSAEEAVYRAAPLPVPSDPTVFDRMRKIQFVFKPEE